MLLEDGFNFFQLDTEAADIYSAVVSPRPFNIAIGQISSQLAGFIHPVLPIVGKRIDDKHLLGSFFVTDISCSQMRTAYVKFADSPIPASLAPLVEQQ